jgi:predicted enzyme related to lactoylglutathione lyase
LHHETVTTLPAVTQDSLSRGGDLCEALRMKVERLKYVIWAADMKRAVDFYVKVFGGTLLKQNEIISEISLCGGVIGIHGGGEGKRTWTGLSFQVPDVIAGAAEIVAAGGQLVREPQPEEGEPPHLAMCVDTEGNEFMLSRKRH